MTGLTDESVLITATYRLTPGDAARLHDLPIVKPPQVLTRAKHIDGSVTVVFDPAPRYLPAMISAAGSSLSTIRTALTKIAGRLEVVEAQPTGLARNRVDSVLEALEDKGAKYFATETLSGEEWRDLWAVQQEWSDLNDLRGVKTAWAALQRYYDQVASAEELDQRVLDHLGDSIPKFLTFSSSDRALANEYELSLFDSDSSMPSVLASLFEFAGLSLARLLEASEDEPLAEAVVAEANRTMREKFQARWKQSKVSVVLKLESTLLKVFIEDTEFGSMAFFSERSDGLRMFVALMLFLERQDADEQTILLIDEADMHLHLDAQADLIRMLSTFQGIAQVLYTTHSPGCLPPDLGTGVRFVVPNPAEPATSQILPFFWTRSATPEKYVGFMPMLFMLGARSAAFSRLRYALVVEGQTEAIILPSLIRAAAGLDELAYQVVPGLSQVGDSDFAELSSVAVNVSYLVDGDAGGDALLEVLETRTVPRSRRFQLPRGLAVEDLIDPTLYVTTVNKFLTSKQVKVTDLAGGTAKARLAAWAQANRVAVPGPVVIAEALLTGVESGEVRLKLAKGAGPALKALDTRIQRTFAPDSSAVLSSEG